MVVRGVSIRTHARCVGSVKKTGTRSRRASTASPATWSRCSWVIRIASSVAGSSFAAAIRRSSSRHDSPASTSTRVRLEEMTVLLPFDPEASTVIRIMLFSIRRQPLCRSEPSASRFPTRHPLPGRHPTPYTLSLRPRRSQKVHRRAHHHLVALVIRQRPCAYHPIVLARVRQPRPHHLDLGADGVARPYRLGPAHLLHPGADHPARHLDALHPQPHHNRRRQPARRRQPLEERALARRLIQVKRLRIVLLAKLLDLLRRHLGAAGRVKHLPDIKILKVQFLRHRLSRTPSIPNLFDWIRRSTLWISFSPKRSSLIRLIA